MNNIVKVTLTYEDGTTGELQPPEKLVTIPQNEFNKRYVDRNTIIEYAKQLKGLLNTNPLDLVSLSDLGFEDPNNAIMPLNWMIYYFKITDEELQ